MKNLLQFNFEKRFSENVIIRASDTITFADDLLCAAVVGPSGSGKTTFLRWVAGLSCDGGLLQWNDETWSSPQRDFVSPQNRHIGYLSQSYDLFPHLSVFKNIAYGLKNKETRESQVKKLLRIFEIETLENQKIHTLSGGQKQRVAFARALARGPRLLLLDEPFNALDHRTREKLMRAFSIWIKELQTPVLMVTHNPDEARALSNKMITFS